MVRTEMKKSAKAYPQQNVTHTVITVPAYFNDAQCQATKHGGTIAGLQVLRIVNELTAAPIAYGPDKHGDEKHTIEYKTSGGTFHVFLLAIDDSIFGVLATAGDSHLGGGGFEKRDIDYFVK